MWKIASVIIKNGSLVLFVLLQSICLYWVVKYNQPQQKIFLHSYQLMGSAVSSKYKSTVDYFSLKSKYDSVSAENAQLLLSCINTSLKWTETADSSFMIELKESVYKVIPAKVINNSIDKRNNMLSLDRGGAHGISPGMGVVSSKGIIGIVTDTSKNYSLVMSVLHGSTGISARLKRSGFFGPLVWNGRDPSVMNLEAIQKYADVRLGDTVVTSGYSLVFPRNLLIGTVELYEVNEGLFTYDIKVKLSQSLSNPEQVYVLVNKDRKEQEELEKKGGRYE